jgi:hypothetical protein
MDSNTDTDPKPDTDTFSDHVWDSLSRAYNLGYTHGYAAAKRGLDADPDAVPGPIGTEWDHLRDHVHLSRPAAAVRGSGLEPRPDDSDDSADSGNR